eukprot:1676144-Pyramimonas_sp.AAC.1
MTRDIQAVAGWSSELAVHTNLRLHKPYSSSVASLYSAALWQVLCPLPSGVFIEAVHALQREALECATVSGVSSYVGVLALALTTCLTICRIRSLFTGGRKARGRARHLCHCLPPVLQSAFGRQEKRTF